MKPIFIFLIATFGAFLLTGLGPDLKIGSEGLYASPKPFTASKILLDNDGDAQNNLQLNSFKLGSSCPSKIVLDFVVDTSCSMNQPVKKTGRKKVDFLKEATRSFISLLDDNIVIGLQSFDGRVRDFNIDIDKTLVNRSKFLSAINQFNNTKDCGTHTKDGMKRGWEMIKEARLKPELQGYTWTMILLTDGSPVPFREQNPSQVASEIRKDDIRIISIAAGIGSTGGDISAKEAEQLLKSLASSSSDFYNIEADQINDVYKSITTSLCEDTSIPFVPSPSPSISPSPSPSPSPSLSPSPSASPI